MGAVVKEEAEVGLGPQEHLLRLPPPPPPASVSVPVIHLSSSDSDSEGETEEMSRVSDGEAILPKRRKLMGGMKSKLPPGFLDPLPLAESSLVPLSQPDPRPPAGNLGSRQFWKAGDYEGDPQFFDASQLTLGMDHVRVHPKFLHSNATSHKWALGAFAELLDNSLDEVCNGATFVKLDMLQNKKDSTRMLLIEDDGGGMDPDKIRQCMSLGYSAKSKLENCIGQYGNGFKTSTMRLGADVIVFSRSCGKEGKSPTQSIGLLSYTFLRSTGKEDIIVPMLDYERRGQFWDKMPRSCLVDWNRNVETILQWSPYRSEAELLQQFESMKDHGTRIIIYNLWEDDQGELELDFDADKHDIQIRGVNRDEKKIEMAKRFPNSRHFLTYRHSLRSYASILYLRPPRVFRMILRGKEIEHHNIVNDMMLKHEITYRPHPDTSGLLKDPKMVAVVTIGFVKDAKHHIDVQGFNVYHKNRLIKPFWRVWNAAGSDGRGVIGLLEANFVEPAHDKQGFERTTVLSRLEAKLIQMQKTYWSGNCHKIGYAPRCNKRLLESEDNGNLLKTDFLKKSKKVTKGATPASKETLSSLSKKGRQIPHQATETGTVPFLKESDPKHPEKHGKFTRSTRLRTNQMLPKSVDSGHESRSIPFNRGDSISKVPNASLNRKLSIQGNNNQDIFNSHDVESTCRVSTRSLLKAASPKLKGNFPDGEDSQLRVKNLEEENEGLKQKIKEMEPMQQELRHARVRIKTLSNKLEELEKKLEETNREQDALIEIFSEERHRRDEQEATLKTRLKDAHDRIQDLLEKLPSVENNKFDC
ncbi:hypothetical protein AXF42_Ash009565 [Apostasia shenzhenica]|uniref:Morc S5 domain-containing protein n=1 Tax=Apostasia shenzhenica TaxID=1088818 RepID=A0A2I0B973_9ASPA|nr:hypothetical protein AXF42_Ash009565 [Apostasia shenzhenica]